MKNYSLFDVELEVTITILDLTCQEREITITAIFTPFEEYYGDRVVGVYLYPTAIRRGKTLDYHISAIEEDLIIAEANSHNSYGDVYNRSCAY